MHFQEYRFFFCTVSSVIVLLASSLLALSVCAEAADTTSPQFSSPLMDKQDHARHDVSANGAYIPVSPRPEKRGCNVDMPGAAKFYSEQVASLFWSNGSELERLVNEWSDPSCVFKDGRPIMMALSMGYDIVLRNKNDRGKTYARIEELKNQFPNKPFVALAESVYWITSAWDARGTGCGCSVPEVDMMIFHERLEKAEKILIDSKSYAANLPQWYEKMIVIQGGLGRSIDERNKVFMEGVKRYPTYYPIYFAMSYFLEPKWGGSWRAVDNLVQWSVEHTKAQEGMTMYARIYWSMYGDSDVNFFEDTPASWPKMKQGFEDIMARHPASKWNLNQFAKLACVAGDKNTFLALRKKIGKDVFADAWTGNATLDLCDTKFGYAE